MEIKFRHITSSKDTLYGLTDDGCVYKYIPSNTHLAEKNPELKLHYAFWVKLTSYTAQQKEDK